MYTNSILTYIYILHGFIVLRSNYLVHLTQKVMSIVVSLTDIVGEQSSSNYNNQEGEKHHFTDTLSIFRYVCQGCVDINCLQ